ncbi:MAG: molecular chaperone DnaJ [Lachnospiraceae bacterium]|jgi:molecular chaperone DnaJ|nr:molecular chaperone DnaJ [Lachnospiraceae bacterium]
MAESKRDYYEVLGIEKTADDAAIKKAYRTLAKKYHPDMNPGDATAEMKFKEASEAYAVLSDPEKRRQYDQFGHAAFEGGAGGGGFDFSGSDFTDIFSEIFGDFFGGSRRSYGGRGNGPTKGANLRVSMRIKFEEAIFGCEKKIELSVKDNCTTCNGTGAKSGTTPETCPKCAGKGQTVTVTQSFFGPMKSVTTCPDCQGTGKIIREKCPDCRGTGYISKKKQIPVEIPAGIDNGQSIILRDLGEPGSNGGPRGDVRVEISVERHPIFQRQETNIYSTVHMPFTIAALGGDIVIETVHGKVLYEVRPGTQTDTKVRLRGKGVPHIRNKESRGDHYVTLVIQVPDKLTQEAKDLLRQFDAMTGDALKQSQKVASDNKNDPNEKKKFWSKK